MAIRFKVMPMRNPTTQVVKYYPQPAASTPVTYDTVGQEVEKITSLSTGDVKNALMSLEYVIKQHLLNGDSVRLGDIGSFRITFQSVGASAEAGATADLVKAVRVRFTPTAKLKASVNKPNATFVKVGTGSSAADSGDNGETA